MSSMIIVGATDTSAGHRALAWAARRAEDRRQRMLLYGIVGGATGVVGSEAVVAEGVAAIQGFLDREAEALRARGLTVDTRVAAGDPSALLVDASADAALLVIGSDYRGPGRGPARGVHGIRIAAGSACPVIVVPDIDVADTERSGVVVGVDGSEVSEAAVRFAAAEADRLGEPLIAVTAWAPVVVPRHFSGYPQSYLDSMKALSAETLAIALAGLRQDYPELQIDARVERGFPSQAINELAADARLAVLGSHGRGAVRRFLLGSISHEVLMRLATVTAVVR